MKIKIIFELIEYSKRLSARDQNRYYFFYWGIDDVKHFKIFTRETFLIPTFFVLLFTKIPKSIKIKKYLTWSSILSDNQPGTNLEPKSYLIFFFGIDDVKYNQNFH